MANDWTRSPFILTAAENHTFRGIIRFVRWYDPTNTGDTIVIRDFDDREVLRMKAVAGVTEHIKLDTVVDAIKINNPTGKVFIYWDTITSPS